MPIFMDRHYAEDATRLAIEMAHEKDLLIQDKHGVKFLTYWFDEERCTTFCLVDAPDRESIQLAHDEAHGGVPHEIIEVDPQAVAAFLGRVNDPTPPSPGATATIDSAYRVIMFTDLKDSTLMTTIYGDKKALHLLHIHNLLIRKALGECGGTEVKHTGDGFMASFTSADAAIDCAVAIQQAFARHNQTAPDEELHIRIGLSAGEPIEEQGDLFGSAVQLAARLCAHADPGVILAAETVRDSCRIERQTFTHTGEEAMKGFTDKVPVYKVEF